MLGTGGHLVANRCFPCCVVHASLEVKYSSVWKIVGRLVACRSNHKWTVTELNLNCYGIDQSVHYIIAWLTNYFISWSSVETFLHNTLLLHSIVGPICEFPH